MFLVGLQGGYGLFARCLRGVYALVYALFARRLFAYNL